MERGNLALRASRPDIAFALGTLSRFTSQPQSHHQVALQRLLRYVKATQCHRITYRSGQLIGYTDADFGGSVVTDGACSTSGYVFQLAGAPVSWSSKRQGEVATSTTHAEYIGQYNALLHLQWLRTFLAETQMYRSPVTNIMADNQSAIALSRNPEFHKRTKHFNVKFHYQRAVLNAGEIGLQYVPTEEQAADGLTKPLGPTAFAKFCRLLGIEALETRRQQTGQRRPSFHFIFPRRFLSGFTEACLHSVNPVSPCQQSDPEGECCDMRLVQIRNQAVPSELAPKCLYRRPS
jgi:hypothetical protein